MKYINYRTKPRFIHLPVPWGMYMRQNHTIWRVISMHLNWLNGQKGLLVFINGEIMGLDVISRNLLTKFFTRS